MAFQIQDLPYNWYGEWYDYSTAVQDTTHWLAVYEQGCQVPGGWNCTKACLDPVAGPNMVWNSTNSTYTLHNCMVLPYIATLLARGNLSAEGVQKANKYGIVASATLEDPTADDWPVINNCIQAYCENDGTPGCNPNSQDANTTTFFPNSTMYNRYDGNGPTLEVTFKQGYNTGLCYNLDAVINPDIGGIGMFISYLMQTFIILTAWIAFHCYNTWVRWPFTALLMPFHGVRKASDLASRVQDQIRRSHHTAALVDALVEFQTAQIFFMISVQIAVLIALHNPSYMQATSWQQLWNNIGILFNLALGGLLPVVFAGLLLRRANEKSGFTLVTTSCCVGLSVAVWIVAYLSDPNPNNIYYTGESLPFCGGNIAPIKYCYAYDWFYVNSDSTVKGIPMVVFAVVIQLCLILDQLYLFHDPDAEPILAAQKSTKVHRHRHLNVFRKLDLMILRLQFWRRHEARAAESLWMQRMRIDTRERAMHSLRSCFLDVTEIACAGLNIVLITDYAHILIPTDGEFVVLDLKNWSLGQVISVTIWVPILLKYGWYAFITRQPKRKPQQEPATSTAYESVSPGKSPKPDRPTTATIHGSPSYTTNTPDTHHNNTPYKSYADTKVTPQVELSSSGVELTPVSSTYGNTSTMSGVWTETGPAGRGRYERMNSDNWMEDRRSST